MKKLNIQLFGGRGAKSGLVYVGYDAFQSVLFGENGEIELTGEKSSAEELRIEQHNSNLVKSLNDKYSKKKDKELVAKNQMNIFDYLYNKKKEYKPLVPEDKYRWRKYEDLEVQEENDIYNIKNGFTREAFYSGKAGNVLVEKEIIEPEIKAVYDYSGGNEEWSKLNNNLISGESLTNKQKEWANKISSFVNRFNVTNNFVLYRGVHIDPTNNKRLIDKIITPGSIIENRNVLSTSFSRAKGLDYAKCKNYNDDEVHILFNVLVDEGTKGVPIRSISKKPEETEVLFDMGTNFQIIRVIDTHLENRKNYEADYEVLCRII